MLKQLIQTSRNLLSKSSEILSIIVILLFVGNYQICELFYKNDLIKWWELRTNIYAVLFALVLYIARVNSKGILRFILSVGIGFSVADVIDRLIFDVTVFNKADILMIILTIIISAYNYVNIRSRESKTTSI